MAIHRISSKSRRNINSLESVDGLYPYPNEEDEKLLLSTEQLSYSFMPLITAPQTGILEVIAMAVQTALAIINRRKNVRRVAR
ncbi:unnamed protein product [Trichobilharzia regenti]|nr:unnamed protein product [Trichobilharzia regenti]